MDPVKANKGTSGQRDPFLTWRGVSWYPWSSVASRWITSTESWPGTSAFSGARNHAHHGRPHCKSSNEQSPFPESLGKRAHGPQIIFTSFLPCAPVACVLGAPPESLPSSYRLGGVSGCAEHAVPMWNTWLYYRTRHTRCHTSRPHHTPGRICVGGSKWHRCKPCNWSWG